MASQRQQDSEFNALGRYVYEGVWGKYSEPAFQKWKWTVKDWKALLILACVAMLIAFTQTKAWVLIRYIIILRKYPVRLPQPPKPESFEHLSQGRAIAKAILSIKS